MLSKPGLYIYYLSFNSHSASSLRTILLVRKMRLSNLSGLRGLDVTGQDLHRACFVLSPVYLITLLYDIRK